MFIIAGGIILIGLVAGGVFVLNGGGDIEQPPTTEPTATTGPAGPAETKQPDEPAVEPTDPPTATPVPTARATGTPTSTPTATATPVPPMATFTPEPTATATSTPAICEPGWLPETGWVCCGTALVGADGTVAEFNPACGVGGDQPSGG